TRCCPSWATARPRSTRCARRARWADGVSEAGDRGVSAVSATRAAAAGHVGPQTPRPGARKARILGVLEVSEGRHETLFEGVSAISASAFAVADSAARRPGPWAWEYLRTARGPRKRVSAGFRRFATSSAGPIFP